MTTTSDIRTPSFKKKPVGGVRYDDPDGIYWAMETGVASPRRMQVICVGPVGLSPREIADLFELGIVEDPALRGIRWRVSRVGVLASPAAWYLRQIVLDRGFLDIWLEVA